MSIYLVCLLHPSIKPCPEAHTCIASVVCTPCCMYNFTDTSAEEQGEQGENSPLPQSQFQPQSYDSFGSFGLLMISLSFLVGSRIATELLPHCILLLWIFVVSYLPYFLAKVSNFNCHLSQTLFSLYKYLMHVLFLWHFYGYINK